MDLLESVLVALSLCADCFAVSLCSSVTLEKADRASVFRIGLAFALIQSGLLFSGWAFGSLFIGLVEKISHIIGFLLLLYVGGGMLWEGLGNKCEARNLNGFKNVLIGGVATSIDALAVGVARSMGGCSGKAVVPLVVLVFLITFLSVAAGIPCGKRIGNRFGRGAEIAGGAVLVCIGIGILL